MVSMNNQSLTKEPIMATSLKYPIIICSFLIMIGMLTAGYFLKQGIVNFKGKDRTVTVKGISEREVTSDLVVWNLTFKNSGDDLTQLNNKMKEDYRIITDFIKKMGFIDEEIKCGEVAVIDKMAREYGEQANSINRYIFTNSLIVRTNKIDLVIKALNNITNVIEKGVIISGMPAYHYTKFFALRPEMLAEATKSARTAALQFASVSGTQVGSIKTASQGLFSIGPKDSFGENTYAGEYSTIEKKIRVVSTITFNLE